MEVYEKADQRDQVAIETEDFHEIYRSEESGSLRWDEEEMTPLQVHTNLRVLNPIRLRLPMLTLQSNGFSGTTTTFKLIEVG